MHTQSEDNKEKKARRRGIEVVLEVLAMVAHVGSCLLRSDTTHTSAASKDTKTEGSYAPKKPFREIDSRVSEV